MLNFFFLQIQDVEVQLYYHKFDKPEKLTISYSNIQGFKKNYMILKIIKLLSMQKRFTFKSLFSSNLERHNVRLVMKIFNKFVVEGLLKLGPVHNIPHFKRNNKIYRNCKQMVGHIQC